MGCSGSCGSGVGELLSHLLGGSMGGGAVSSGVSGEHSWLEADLVGVDDNERPSRGPPTPGRAGTSR
jgi:hypothetical protein